MNNQESGQAQLISVCYYNDTFPGVPTDLINRDAVIDAIKKNLEKYDILFIEGDEGVGKTTLLAHFVQLFPNNCISHFVTPTYTFSFSPINIKSNLFRQINFYANGVVTEDTSIDDSIFNSVNTALQRKIRRTNEPLFFIFDGLCDLDQQDIEALSTVFSNLPFGKVKFIFSGNDARKKLSQVLSEKLPAKEIPLLNFGLSETKEYFKDFETTETEIQEIHKICSKGLPQKLSIAKRNCKELGSIKALLDSQITENTDLFDFDWGKVDANNHILNLTLATIAFDDAMLNIKQLSEILNIPINQLKSDLDSLSFLSLQDETIGFITESHKLYAQKKLIDLKDQVLDKLILFYQQTGELDHGSFNLPSLYQKAKKWQDLTQYLSIDSFVKLVENYQSLATVKRQFDYGLNASKQINLNNKFSGDYLRFALHKSSFKELEKYEVLQGEIEARMAVGEYEQALTLANSAFLKEDRFKLLAILAKQRVELKLGADKLLNDQIQDLYKQIDFLELKDRAFQIASILVYSCFDLAIDIVEKATNNNTSGNSFDYALAYLSLYAFEASKKNSETDADLISNKIKDEDIKNLATAFKFLSAEYNVEQIIQHSVKLKDTKRRLLLLRNWISNNKGKKGVEKAIEFALNEIIKCSSENAPNATALKEIASPLPLISNTTKLEKLIKLFDSQKTTITKPTKDFVELQLIIAEALILTDKKLAKDRIIEVCFLIEEDIKDLKIKNDCLAMIWMMLLKIDTTKEIERALFSTSTIEKQMWLNFEALLQQTALHYGTCESVIKTIAAQNSTFLFTLIPKINTQPRRMLAYKLAAKQYLEGNKVEDYDFGIIDKYLHLLDNPHVQEEVYITLLEKFWAAKDTAVYHVSKLLKYKDQICELPNLSTRCYAVILLIKILSLDKSKARLNDHLVKKLHASWLMIDIEWRKVEVGFKIAKDLAEYSTIEAKRFIDESSTLKEAEPLSSDSLVNTYTLSCKLCIRAFSGLLIKGKSIDSELRKLEEIFNQVRSVGERLKLWNEVALHLHTNGRLDDFRKVGKDYLVTVFETTIFDDKEYRTHILLAIAPSIFLYHQLRFLEIIDNITPSLKDSAIENVCNYILTGLNSEELTEENTRPVKLEFQQYIDLCTLLPYISNDFLLYNFIKQIMRCIKANEGRAITPEQKNDIKFRLQGIIDKNLPNPNHIQHKGYWIIARAQILSTDDYTRNKADWDLLISEARKIANDSDRALVLSMLAEIIEKRNIQNELLIEAFDTIRGISSLIEKSSRFSGMLEIWYEKDSTSFQKFWKIAFSAILEDKEGNINSIKTMIDLAQELDPKLAEHAVSVLDQDPSRRKLKAPLQTRIKSTNEVKKAQQDLSKLDHLTTQQLGLLFSDNLSQLNSGKYQSRNIDDTIEVLEIISRLPLSDSYEAACYFIQNAISKYSNSEKGAQTIYAIFDATYKNAKLVGIVSADNIAKMKNLYKYANSQATHSNPVVRFGDKDQAMNFLKDWITNNAKNKITIIDPYFSAKELWFIKEIKDLNILYEVTILTSKLADLNQESNNKEHFSKAWSNLSKSEPNDVNVNMVWDPHTKSCPFHDRWIIADDIAAGLMLPSISGIGNRDCQIVELTAEGLTNTEVIINDYIYKREKKTRGFNLKYEYFEID